MILLRENGFKMDIKPDMLPSGEILPAVNSTGQRISNTLLTEFGEEINWANEWIQTLRDFTQKHVHNMCIEYANSRINEHSFLTLCDQVQNAAGLFEVKGQSVFTVTKPTSSIYDLVLQVNRVLFATAQQHIVGQINTHSTQTTKEKQYKIYQSIEKTGLYNVCFSKDNVNIHSNAFVKKIYEDTNLIFNNYAKSFSTGGINEHTLDMAKHRAEVIKKRITKMAQDNLFLVNPESIFCSLKRVSDGQIIFSGYNHANKNSNSILAGSDAVPGVDEREKKSGNIADGSKKSFSYYFYKLLFNTLNWLAQKVGPADDQVDRSVVKKTQVVKSSSELKREAALANIQSVKECLTDIDLQVVKELNAVCDKIATLLGSSDVFEKMEIDLKMQLTNSYPDVATGLAKQILIYQTNLQHSLPGVHQQLELISMAVKTMSEQIEAKLTSIVQEDNKEAKKTIAYLKSKA